MEGNHLIGWLLLLDIVGTTTKQTSCVDPRRVDAVYDSTECTIISGLIGFDVETRSRLCDPSCSDSLNGVTQKRQKS